MSRYDLKYSEADMLDAFYAGRQSLIDQLDLNRENASQSPFSDWIDNRNAKAKELRDDEDNYEAQADAKNELNNEI